MSSIQVSGLIELDSASVMMRELCMHALVGLGITCVYVMVRRIGGTVCMYSVCMGCMGHMWHKTVPTSLHMGLGVFMVLY